MVCLRTKRAEDDGLSVGWHVFLQTTDRGPNEVSSRTTHKLLYDQSGPNVLYADMDCLEHCIHLCVMGGLTQTEAVLVEMDAPFKYFASSAVLANVLRDSCRDLFKAWKEMYGISEAMSCARTLFPKCIAGRWGSVHMFEERLLKCGKKSRGTYFNLFFCLLIFLFLQ